MGVTTAIAPYERFITQHTSVHLRTLENSGTTTRSALFNFCLHSTKGCTAVSEDNLVQLMGRTQDLSKSIPSTFAAILAKSNGSDITKLTIYLLIAKKSRNERDDHLLRKAVQEIAIRRFDRSLVSLLSYLGLDLQPLHSDRFGSMWQVFTRILPTGHVVASMLDSIY
jgi:hypothetical protein